MENDFEFEIGEEVCYRGKRSKTSYRIVHLMILGRLTEECIGGIQRFYIVRPFEPGVTMDKEGIRLHDFEVASIPKEEE